MILHKDMLMTFYTLLSVKKLGYNVYSIIIEEGSNDNIKIGWVKSDKDKNKLLPDRGGSGNVGCNRS